MDARRWRRHWGHAGQEAEPYETSLCSLVVGVSTKAFQLAAGGDVQGGVQRVGASPGVNEAPLKKREGERPVLYVLCFRVRGLGTTLGQ